MGAPLSFLIRGHVAAARLHRFVARLTGEKPRAIFKAQKGDLYLEELSICRSFAALTLCCQQGSERLPSLTSRLAINA